MTSKAIVDEFVAQKSLAVVGISRSGQKFGNMVYRELKAKGYQVYAIHPEAEQLEGDRCYPNLAALPEKVGGVVVVLPPAKTEEVVREAKAAGIQRVWMQQGAESAAAIEFCKQNGMQAVSGECIMMFAAGNSFHGFHRWVNGLMGKLPK
jgi:uncharacterized protein